MGPDVLELPDGATPDLFVQTAKDINRAADFLRHELDFRVKELRDARRALQKKEPLIRFLEHKVATLESDKESLRKEVEQLRAELKEKTDMFWKYLGIEKVQEWE